MEELDQILIQQLQSSKKALKIVKRHLKLMPNDPWLNDGLIIIQRKINFFEEMINDKSLLKKKIKIKKEKDALEKNTIYTFYRNIWLVTFVGYNIFCDSIKNYISMFKKEKNEKNSQY
jgi:hypothetical protein